jgi:hypothetical protein
MFAIVCLMDAFPSRCCGSPVNVSIRPGEVAEVEVLAVVKCRVVGCVEVSIQPSIEKHKAVIRVDVSIQPSECSFFFLSFLFSSYDFTRS